jgi:hypothetical protein
MNGTLLLIYVIGILINIFYIKYKNGMNRFKFDTTILLMYISYLSWFIYDKYDKTFRISTLFLLKNIKDIIIDMSLFLNNINDTDKQNYYVIFDRIKSLDNNNIINLINDVNEFNGDKKILLYYLLNNIFYTLWDDSCNESSLFTFCDPHRKSDQSKRIKYGSVLEKTYNNIIDIKSDGIYLINLKNKLSKSKIDKTQIDILYQLGNTINYRESKVNTELDTEKSEKTKNKIDLIYNKLNIIYYNNIISSKVLSLRYSRKIECKNFKRPLLINDFVGYNDFFEDIGLTEIDFNSYKNIINIGFKFIDILSDIDNVILSISDN